MSFVKDSKEMGKQMSNVAPPPKQPSLQYQQKIQIVKSADGKIRVRGLLPGQHLFKMPDGKYQIYQLKYQHGAKLAPPGQVIASIPHQKQLPVKSNPSQQHLLYARQFPLCSLPHTCQFPLCSLPDTWQFPLCSLPDTCQFPLCSLPDTWQFPLCSLPDTWQFPLCSLPDTYQFPLCSLPHTCQFPLCSLPDTALETVLLFLPYDTIAKLRRVNRRFDAICKSLLNKGFLVAKRNVSDSLQQVKSKLPRRDSERDSHPMFNDYGILTTTRLEVAFLSRFINVHVCFIPGKILDEIFSILSTLREKEDARRPQSILNELRDLRVMALEYFEENIAPSFPKEQAPVAIPLEFPAEEEDCSSNECGDGPVANIRENTEAIRACSRRVLKLTKQKKRMKMQLKIMTMQMKQQNMRFNVTVKQQKANLSPRKTILHVMIVYDI